MIISIRQVSRHLPVSYYSLLNWSKDPTSPFYPTFLKIGNKICVDLEALKAIGFKENERRAEES